MKKKFLVLTLCFTILFSSINFRKSYAFAGSLSLPLLATVCTVAVGTGIALNSNDDLYNIGSLFYNKYKDDMDRVNSIFNMSVALSATGTLLIGNDFLKIIDEFLDGFSSSSTGTGATFDFDGYVGTLPIYSNLKGTPGNCLPLSLSNISEVTKINITKDLCVSISPRTYGGFNLSIGGVGAHSTSSVTVPEGTDLVNLYGQNIGGGAIFLKVASITGNAGSFYLKDNPLGIAATYDGNVLDNVKDEDGNISVGIPSNLGSLVGSKPDVFSENPSYDTTKDGSVSLPTVDNPSISVDSSVSFPQAGVDSSPGTKPVLPSLPTWGSGLDFSPITQGVFTDKFPFCLAKDVMDIISVFDVSTRNVNEPVFKFPLLSEELVIDFGEFKLWFDVVKFFILIGFIISLIVLTRGIIG